MNQNNRNRNPGANYHNAPYDYQYEYDNRGYQGNDAGGYNAEPPYGYENPPAGYANTGRGQPRNNGYRSARDQNWRGNNDSRLYSGLRAGLDAAGVDGGMLQDIPAFLRSRNTEQFLLGALIGAAAAWVLSDEEIRGKIVKSAVKVYSGVAGGLEEMKEQMADIRAEVESEADE